MTKSKRLQAVGEQSDPLTLDGLRVRGNELLTQAHRAAVDALAVSAQARIFQVYRYRKSGGIRIGMIRGLKREADEAVAAWTAVSGALGELINEFDRAKAAGETRR